jgi:polo-like kinase 1
VRTTTGFNRNLFYNRQSQNQKEDLYQFKSNPQLLNNNFLKPDSSKVSQRLTLSGYQSIYVKKWVDYSSKYGLGYLLSDGTTGIYFNDSTKMILD